MAESGRIFLDIFSRYACQPAFDLQGKSSVKQGLDLRLGDAGAYHITLALFKDDFDSDKKEAGSCGDCFQGELLVFP